MKNDISLIDIAFTDNYVNDIILLFEQAKQYVHKHINYAMIHTYWLTGKRIVLQEKRSDTKVKYGKELMQELSQELTIRFGKGFSTQSLYNFKMFYERFSEVQNFSTGTRVQ